MILLFLSACQYITGDPPRTWTYSEFLEVCSDVYYSGEEIVSNDWWVRLPEITSECSAAVGEVIGMDWESFDEQPMDFSRTSSNAKFAVKGFLQLVAPNALVLTEETLSSAPELFASTIRENAALLDDPLSTDLGKHLFHYAQNAFHRTVLDLEIESAMAYNSGTLFFGDYAGENPEHFPWFSYEISPIAPVLVHEAAHSDYDFPHVECPPGEYFGGNRGPHCDATKEGAYGVQTWWHYQLFEQLVEPNPMEPLCDETVDALQLFCTVVLDVTDFAPCRPEVLEFKCPGY